jgi:hypothetical protein
VCLILEYIMLFPLVVSLTRTQNTEAEVPWQVENEEECLVAGPQGL